MGKEEGEKHYTPLMERSALERQGEIEVTCERSGQSLPPSFCSSQTQQQAVGEEEGPKSVLSVHLLLQQEDVDVDPNEISRMVRRALQIRKRNKARSHSAKRLIPLLSTLALLTGLVIFLLVQFCQDESVVPPKPGEQMITPTLPTTPSMLSEGSPVAPSMRKEAKQRGKGKSNTVRRSLRDTLAIQKPLVIFPGIEGVKLGLTVHDKHDYPAGMRSCKMSYPYNAVWIDRPSMQNPCIFYDFMPIDDNETFHRKVNVSVDVYPIFGSEKAVNCLLTGYYQAVCKVWPRSESAYLKTTLKVLKSWGYDSVNRFLATYNWEYDPRSAEHRDLFARLKAWIEARKRLTGQKTVILAHSMGGFFLQYFLLELTTPEWRAEFIESVVFAATPFGGSVKTVKMFTTGEEIAGEVPWIHYKIVFVTKEQVREFARSAPAPATLLPDVAAYGPDYVFARYQNTTTSTTRDFKVKDMDQFLRHIQASGSSVEVYKDYHTRSQLTTTRPDTKIHCYYGVGVDTPGSYLYQDSWLRVTQMNTTGDGTVAKISGQICERWRDQGSGADVDITYIRDANHTSILHDNLFLKSLHSILVQDNGHRRLTTLVKQHEDRICFSRYPIWGCKDTFLPDRTSYILATFVCFNDQKAIRSIMQQLETSPIYLVEDSDFEMEVEQALECN